MGCTVRMVRLECWLNFRGVRSAHWADRGQHDAGLGGRRAVSNPVSTATAQPARRCDGMSWALDKHKISHTSPSPALRERVRVRVLLPGSSCSELSAFVRKPGAASGLFAHRRESEKRSCTLTLPSPFSHPLLASPANERARGTGRKRAKGLRGARHCREFFEQSHKWGSHQQGCHRTANPRT
jgi:hypothetical protein